MSWSYALPSCLAFERCDVTVEFAPKRSQAGLDRTQTRLYSSQVGLHDPEFGSHVLDACFEIPESAESFPF